MPRVRLIANPVAARAKARVAEALVATLRSAGCEVDLCITTGPGDARRFAEEAVAVGVDTVAVYGGDGTVMQAAAGLIGTRVALGVIPGGTGNLLAGNLRLPRDPHAAALVVARRVVRTIDVARLENDHETAWFAVAAGAGLDAKVMRKTGAASKRRWRMGAYIGTLLRELRHLRTWRFRLTVDGRTFEEEAAVVLIANSGEVIPPLLRLGHGITLDDGWLDLVVVRASTIGQAIQTIWQGVRGFPPGPTTDRLFRYERGTTIHVETGGPVPVQFDGETSGNTPFSATLVPRGLTVIVPVNDPQGKTHE